MTVCDLIAPCGATEPPLRGFTHTQTTQRFAAMQSALHTYIEAERDLEHSGSWDIACDHWLRDAEVARSEVCAALDLVCGCEVTRPEDRPLRRIAHAVRRLILSDDGDEFARVMQQVINVEPLLYCPVTVPVARRINQMLAETRRQVQALAALPDYGVTLGGEYEELGETDLTLTDAAVDVTADILAPSDPMAANREDAPDAMIAAA